MTTNRNNLVGTADLFAASYTVFRNNLKTYVLLGLLVALPYTLLSFLGQYYFGSNFNIDELKKDPNFVKLVVGYGVANLLAMVVTSLASLATIYFTHKQVSENYQTSLLNVLMTGFDKLLAFIWLSVLATAWMFGGFLLFIIPGVILMVRLSLWAYVLVVEELRGLDALVRSRSLVKGYTTEAFVRWFAVYSATLVMIALNYYFGPSAPKTLAVLLGIVTVFVAPFTLVYGYFLYSNFVTLKVSNK